MRHFAYWNLHKHLFSLRSTRTGRVEEHTRGVIMADVTLAVGQAGRARVLASGHKNVHAGVRGTVAGDPTDGWPAGEWIPVTYNPRKGPTFVRRDTGEPVFSARLAVLRATVDARPLVMVSGIARGPDGWVAS